VSTNHVLLVTSDVVGEKMAGPGIRCWELARVLSQHFRVTLAVPPLLEGQQPAVEPDFSADVRLCGREQDLRQLLDDADVILTLGAMMRIYPFLANTGKPLVIDAYDPFLLAGLQQQSGAPDEKRRAAHEEYLRAHLLALDAADFVLCASDTQRDYWLGMLSALGRINPYTHDEDPTLARLIAVVPFGLPGAAPRHSRQVLKGVYRGIGPEDRVVLWAGGIWDWLDAETAVRAMARLARDRADVKLFFMGTERPNRTVATPRAVEETKALSRSLGLAEQSVFFHDWVPYEDRESYLLEADVGISLHRDVLESRFAFRTRLMDHLWAGLPTVATGGDVLGEELGRRGVANLVPPGDDEATASALRDLLDTPNLKGTLRPRFATAAADYRWEVVAEPLVEFCRNPRLAPDREYLGKASWLRRAWTSLRRGN